MDEQTKAKIIELLTRDLKSRLAAGSAGEDSFTLEVDPVEYTDPKYNKQN